ncbi:hypothetical protein BZG17_26175, partial [Escherichia coli]|nr:hypothetical protein [Escherichia coli]
HLMKRRKSIWAGLLMSVMLLGHIGLYGGLAFADSNTGNQEWVPPLENDWVIISTQEQLVYVDQNQEQFVDKQIRLDNDIDLTGVNWVPFGGNDYAPFSGTFDGRGHTISGLVINGDTRLNVGFFGEANGTIRNIS